MTEKKPLSPGEKTVVDILTGILVRRGQKPAKPQNDSSSAQRPKPR